MKKLSENEEQPESLKGYFIISESNMLDPNFYQTVVLLIEHNKDGAFGLVVNRRANLTLGDVMSAYANPRGFSSVLYSGGPVQPEYLFVIHSELPDGSSPSESVVEVLPGQVYFEPGFRNVAHFFEEEAWNRIPSDDRPALNLYLGYSGWAPGQLEKELKQGSWIIHPATKKIIFHDNPEQGWRDALRDKGGIYRIFADSKQDPGLN